MAERQCTMHAWVGGVVWCGVVWCGVVCVAPTVMGEEQTVPLKSRWVKRMRKAGTTRTAPQMLKTARKRFQSAGRGPSRKGPLPEATRRSMYLCGQGGGDGPVCVLAG
jgi:hypothetical protein